MQDGFRLLNSETAAGDRAKGELAFNLLAPAGAAKLGKLGIVGAVPEGVVYLRTDITGRIAPYGGQAESEVRFFARQNEHARKYPNSDFDFSIVDRANPGASLDIAEHNFIQKLSGGLDVRDTSLVSNLKNPVGAARRAEFGLPEPKRKP